jgi:intracellular sulfur oxidation DsrE/DsrF family protein
MHDLYEKLNTLPTDASHIDQVLQLQHQIQAIEDEIQALQNLLETEEANKKVKVVDTDHAVDAVREESSLPAANEDLESYSVHGQRVTEEHEAGAHIDIHA